MRIATGPRTTVAAQRIPKLLQPNHGNTLMPGDRRYDVAVRAGVHRPGHRQEPVLCPYGGGVDPNRWGGVC